MNQQPTTTESGCDCAKFWFQHLTFWPIAKYIYVDDTGLPEPEAVFKGTAIFALIAQGPVQWTAVANPKESR